MRTAAVLAALTLTIASFPAHAVDWPQWRGAERRGVGETEAQRRATAAPRSMPVNRGRSEETTGKKDWTVPALRGPQ